MKNIAIFGSTGSIGINTLKVIEAFPENFRVTALSANSNSRLLSEQIKKFKPNCACLMTQGQPFARAAGRTKMVFGLEGLLEIVSRSDVDLVVLAISGSVSLLPLLRAIEKRKEIALASKEAMVSGGEIVTAIAKKNNVKIIPIDSEHSAIFQCLNGNRSAGLRKIYLTGTGGPLRDAPSGRFDKLSPRQVINHPKWRMGKKISVDSATLMNKGLEIIEAKWLFSAGLEQIEVLIHPEAVIHSMVEFIDGSILAQLSVTDMRLPIQYALGYPARLRQRFNLFMDFKKADKLTFAPPDTKKFPCLELAWRAARDGGTFPAVLNAGNEEAVLGFLNGEIKFTRIPGIVEGVLSRHRGIDRPDLGDILEADMWAREEARKLCCR